MCRKTYLFPWIFAVILIVFSLAPLHEALSQESAEELYEAALFKKEADGDLKGAIQLFLRIITKFPENRKMCAKAQLQIGICYEKLGLKEAQKAYQKVIDKYPEQTEAVKVAKEKLSLLLRARVLIEKVDREFKMRQIWTGLGMDIRGAPSPDGRYLSYIDLDTGDLAVLEIATGKKRRLTNKGSWLGSSEHAGASKFSPDGKQVAYNWRKRNNFQDLRIIRLDGSGLRVFYRNEELRYVYPSDWSPDGKYILATLLKKGGTGQIVLVSVADGSVRVLKNFGEELITVCLSPDGRYIAYDFPHKEDPFKYDIFLLSVDGKQEIPLVEHPANDRLLGWAPNGKWILFSSDRVETRDAWVIPVAEGEGQGDPQLIKRDIGRISPMGFTPEGSFYYGKGTWMFHLYISTLDLTTGKVLAPPKKVTQRIVPFNSSVDLSPDGKHLAYISQGALGTSVPGPTVISVRSLKTGEERELRLKLFRLYRLRWFPDGRSILVQDATKKMRSDFYLLDTQTGDVTAIVRGEPEVVITDPAGISPDGKTIFYRRIVVSKMLHKIMARDLKTGQEKELYRLAGPPMVLNPVLSPDGHQLVFIVRVRNQRKMALKVIPAAGGEPRELLTVKFPEKIVITSLAWTPDSRQILFGRGSPLRKEKTELWRISVEGGEPRKLGLVIDHLFHLRVHPDGRRIVYTGGEYKAEIWMMENFLPEEKIQKKSKLR